MNESRVDAEEPGMLRKFIRLASGYWRGETRSAALLLLFGLIVCLIVSVAAQVAINRWNKYFFDALQSKNILELWRSVGLLAALALFTALAAVALLQVRMRLQLRWRTWLTTSLLQRWMGNRRFYQLSILRLIDNPEARIAEDGRIAIELLVDFATGISYAMMTAVSFVGVLFFVGGDITVFELRIPGYMVIAAIVYPVFSSYAMLLLGRPLVAAVEEKAATEADFRYRLTRTRENAETIALIGGDDDELRDHMVTFGSVARRWVVIIGRQARMMFLSTGNNVLAPVVPLLLGAPKFLSGEMSLGDLMAAAAAFTQVQGALNWLADNSLRLADWFASARRVAAIDDSFRELDALVSGVGGTVIDLGFSNDGSLHLKGLSIAQHDGTVMLEDADAVIHPGEKVLVKGDSGSGKSTLIRAMAGLWPWGSGEILRPRGLRMSFMPQRPYIPIGTLRAAINFPQDETDPSDAAITEVLKLCGLEHLSARIDEDMNWAGVLSGGEQQRLAFARVFLKRPNVIIMDEPTSALDEVSQARMMEIMRDRLRDSMVLHVAHRPGLDRYHDREIMLVRPDGSPAHVRESSDGVLRSARRVFRRFLPGKGVPREREAANTRRPRRRRNKADRTDVSQ